MKNRTDSVDSFNLPALVALTIPVLAGPWLFASVQAWSQLVCLGFALVAALIVILNSLRPFPSAVPDAGTPGVGWCAIGLIMLGLGQLAPIQRSQLKAMSNGAEEIRVDFGQETRGPQPISLAPARTRSTLGVLVLATLLFFASYRCLSPKSSHWLMLAIAVNGSLLVLYEMVSRLLNLDKVYGLVDTSANSFGPIVNRNNAAGFLLSSAAAALWVVVRNLDPEEEDQQRLLTRLLESPIAIAGALCLACCSLGVLASESRGGMLALVAGLAGALVIQFRPDNYRSMSAIGFALTSLLLIGLSVLGNGNLLTTRVAGLLDEYELAGDGRLDIWSGCIRYASDFWTTGSGLGTFRDVFRLYDEHSNGTWATYAENTWIEMACTGGFIGVSILVVMLLLLTKLVLRSLIASNHELQLVGTVGTFFLLSQFVASQFDYGLSIPGNLMVAAVLAAAVVSQGADGGRLLQEKQSDGEPVTSSLSNQIMLHRQPELILVGLIGLGVLIGIDLMRASSVERVAKSPTSNSVQSALSRQQEDLQHVRLKRAIVNRWDDGPAHYALAESYISKYEAFLRARTKVVDVPVTSVSALRSVVVRLRSDEKHTIAMETLLDAPPTEQLLLPALRHLRAAREANCLIPRVHHRLHHLAVLDLEEQVSLKHLKRAVHLWEGRRHDYFRQGLEHYVAKDFPAAFRPWQRCLLVPSRYRSQIVALAARVAEPTQLINQLFPHEERLFHDVITQDLDEAIHQDLRNEMIKFYDTHFDAIHSG